MNTIQESVFTKRELTIIRWCCVIAGAVAVLGGIVSKSFPLTLGVLFCFILLMGCPLGLVYLLRRKQRLFLLNAFLLLLLIIASGLALPVIAGRLQYAGSQQSATSLIKVCNFIRAYWWILFTVGGAVLWLTFGVIERRFGHPAASGGLRWVVAAQIFFLVTLGTATFLTILK